MPKSSSRDPLDDSRFLLLQTTFQDAFCKSLLNVQFGVNDTSTAWDVAVWLTKLENKEKVSTKRLTITSIRRMICRVQEEIAEYEIDCFGKAKQEGCE